MKEANEDDIINFLWRSNQIEGVHSLVALSGAIKAWETALYTQDWENPTWEIEDILRVHNDLLYYLNTRIAGNLTTIQTTVGGRDNPAPQLVEELLEEWREKYGYMSAPNKEAYTEKTQRTAAAFIKEAHIAFEHIHPFEDGNGRVGRIIMNQQRLSVGLPIFAVWPDSEKMVWEDDVNNIFQYEYYKWF